MPFSPRLFLLLAVFYFSQGLPFGLLAKGLPAIARDQGLSNEMIGWLALPAAPWVLKFIWAPWVDQLGRGRPNHRKRWIIAMQLLAVTLLMLISFLSPAQLFNQHFIPFLILLTLLNATFATHDIASDGLAVRMLPVNQRGLGNSVQTGAYKTGLIISSSLFLLVIDQYGWQTGFVLLSLILLLLLWPVMRFDEPIESSFDKRDTHTRSVARRWWHDLIRFWWRPGFLVWLLVLLLYKVGDSFGSRMIYSFLIDGGWSVSDIGSLSLLSSLVGLAGAALGGLLLVWLPRIVALISFAILHGLMFVGWAHVDASNLISVYWVSALEQLVDGMATVAIFTFMMDRCRADHEGSDYTQQASVLMASAGLFTLASGYSASFFGYTHHFMLSAGLCLLAIIPAFSLIGSNDQHVEPANTRKQNGQY